MRITIFDKSFNQSQFACEEDGLTEYLKNQVSQDIKKGLAVCFVMVNDVNRILGYYTLTTESLGREAIPEKYQKKIPKNYNAPVVLLGRLARDISAKGQNIGEELLLDALFRSYRLSQKSIGAMAVVVDPIHEKAAQFYEKYGFIRLPVSEKMFLPMNTISKMI